MFRDAIKAITRPADEEPEQKTKRRRGDTEGEFKRLARYLRRRVDARRSFRSRAAIASRFVPLDPEAHAVAAEYLTTTLDMLNQLDDGAGIDLGDDFVAISHFSSLDL
jgi:hypothetical protein